MHPSPASLPFNLDPAADPAKGRPPVEAARTPASRGSRASDTLGGLPLAAAITLFLALVAAALFAVEAGRPRLLGVCKPAATAALLLIVGLPPGGRFGILVAVGLVFSLGGDVALLDPRPRAFLTGLVLFLVAHVCYAAAFVGAGGFGFPVLAGGAVVAGMSATLVRALWPRLHRLRGPVVAYALAISVMVVSALSTVGGTLPRDASLAAAAGAFGFYLSDANLAWSRFGRAYPHAQTLTLTLYWAGQLGIALAVRWAVSR